MGQLLTQLRISNPDDFYESILESHQDLSDDESRQLNAQLILILANHIGRKEILDEALLIARESIISNRL